LVLLAMVYLLTIIFPQLFFKQKIEYKNFTVYSDTQLNENINKILDEVNVKLESSELYTDKLHYNLYICNNFLKYKYFANIRYDSLAITMPLTNNIFIGNTDIKKDLVFADRQEYNKRSLSSVIVHEAIHRLISSEYGVIRSLFMTTWKKEGYCDYIANTTSFDINKGLEIFKNNENNETTTFKYFLWRLRISYLINLKNQDFNTILKTEYDPGALDREIKTESNINYLF